MKKTLTALIFTFLCLTGYTQYDFIPGYIVKANGDTLNGLVFYGTDGSFRNKCKFKRFEIAEVVTYKAGEILAFGFRNGRYFESRSTGSGEGFFECLVKGEVSLYILPGKNKGSFYLVRSSSDFIELEPGQNRVPGTGETGDFRAVLRSVLSDYDNVQEIDAMAYNSGALISLIRSYNQSTNSFTRNYNQTRSTSLLGDFSVNRSKPFREFGIAVGYQYSMLKMNDTKKIYLKNAEFYSSMRPVFGLYFNRQVSNLGSPVSLDMSALLIRDTYYGYAEYDYSAYHYRDDIYIDITGIQVPFGLKFDLSQGKVRPYLKAGLFYNFLLTHEYTRYEEEQYYDEIYSDVDHWYNVSSDIGIHGSAGLNIASGAYRIISLELTYQRDTQNLTRPVEKYWAKLYNHNISIMLRVNL